MVTINNKLEYKDKESGSFEMVFVAEGRGRCRAVLIKLIHLWFILKIPFKS
jgi:hypothetical protein